MSKWRQSGMVPIVVVATLMAGLVGCGLQSPGEQWCGLLTSIANDPNKVSYTKQWIGTHLADERFRESLRDLRTLPSHDGRMKEFGAFDWKYLGIADGAGWLEFHGALESSGRLDVSRINAVEVSIGRSSILVRLSSENSARQTWSPEHLEETRAVGDDVFVYCDKES